MVGHAHIQNGISKRSSIICGLISALVTVLSGTIAPYLGIIFVGPIALWFEPTRLLIHLISDIPSYDPMTEWINVIATSVIFFVFGWCAAGWSDTVRGRFFKWIMLIVCWSVFSFAVVLFTLKEIAM